MSLALLSALIASLLTSWAAAAESQALAPRLQRNYASTNTRFALPATQEPIPDISRDYELLDTVLLASVDGRFHALNRTSGQTLWSMSSFATTTSISIPSSLAPLVRTTHVQHDPEVDDEESETYIIEPQSGDIYVLQSPSAPLQRFPFSMSELVDISPFTSVGDHGETRFIGRKETSLLVIELETGRIKATLTAECPFVPEEYQDIPADADEFDGKAPVSEPTEVYIARTDYRISITKQRQKGKAPRVIQELSFSSYGPNNKDNHLQSLYRRTADNTYMQALPTGELIAFHAHNSSAPRRDHKKKDDDGSLDPAWALFFPNTIVAVFDVLKAAPSSAPFVLLQPQPMLADISHPGAVFPSSHVAYIGLVEETGSLFALSPSRFPLVVFGARDRSGLTSRARHAQTIDAGTGKNPVGDNTNEELEHCLRYPSSPHCLVGVHQLAEGEADAEVGRWKRLIDPPKADALPAMQQRMDRGRRPETDSGRGVPAIIGWKDDADNASGRAEMDRGAEQGKQAPERMPMPAPVYEPPSPWHRVPLLGDGRTSNVLQGSWEVLSVWLVVGLVGALVMFGRVRSWFRAGRRRMISEHERTKSVSATSESATTSPKADVASQGAEKANGNGTVKFALDTDTSATYVNNAIVDEDVASIPTAPDSTTPVPAVESLDIARPSTPKPKPSALKSTSSNGGVGNQDAVASPLTTPKPVTNGHSKSTPVSSGAVDNEEGDDSEGEAEGATPVAPGKRRSRRGKRGKKKKAVVVANDDEGEKEEQEKDKPKEEERPSSIVLTTSSPKPIVQPSLIVSDTILGFGSHGTVVFQGSLQGRAVAVKRLLQDFVTLAAREVSILQESDDHPNVIRYYYQEAHANFLYIALELCPASLADVIEAPDREPYRDIAINFDPKRALKQITSGLRHLHALKIVHRDIKPQNILVGISPGASASGGTKGGKAYRMLISDFGLCKKLDVDQTSFLPTAHGGMGAGTVGWRAPEILRGEVKLDEMANGDESISSRGSVATVSGSSSSNGLSSGKPTRLTKSVDIFALGCLFYYTLTSGGHPYGDRFEREVNIMRDAKDLTLLERFGEEGTEATDLITGMLSPEARDRPDTTTVLLHPFFWDAGRRLNFLQDASDRFEIMCRDPKDPQLLALERGAFSVVGNDWHSRLDKIFIENLGKFRKYDGGSVQDLMRALRNKKHHYQDLPDNVKRHLGPMPEGYLGYFTRRYPQLFLHVHGVVRDTGLHSESMFRAYFELPDN